MIRRLGGDNIATIGLFVFGLSFALYYQTHAIMPGPIRRDALQYFNIAVNLLMHHIYSMANIGATEIISDSYRPPGYPLFLAVVLRVTNGNLSTFYHSVQTIQALMAAATVAMIFRTGRHFMGFAYAFFAAALLSVWPLAVVQSGYVLTETFFGFLLTLAIWLQCVSLHRKSSMMHALSAIFYACAALVNPMIVPLIICVAGLLALKRQFKFAVILMTIVLLPIVAWEARNSTIPAGAESEGHRLAENILIGMDPEIKEHYNDRYSVAGAAVFERFHADLNTYDRSPREFYSLVLGRLENRPAHYLARYLLYKPREVWYWAIVQGYDGLFVYPVFNSPYSNNSIYKITAVVAIPLEAVLLFFAPVGVFYAFFRSFRASTDAMPMVICATAFCYFTLFYLVLTPDGRYVTPFRGIEFLMAMGGLSWLISVLVSRFVRAGVTQVQAS